MILGTVTAGLEPVISLRILGSEGRETTIAAGIDTGYDGFLTLPQTIIETLALPFWGTGEASLGDGSDIRVDIFLAAVIWHDDIERPALVLRAEGGALVGMSMLGGSRLTIDVEAGGPVLVEPLPSSG